MYFFELPQFLEMGLVLCSSGWFQQFPTLTKARSADKPQMLFPKSRWSFFGKQFDFSTNLGFVLHCFQSCPRESLHRYQHCACHFDVVLQFYLYMPLFFEGVSFSVSGVYFARPYLWKRQCEMIPKHSNYDRRGSCVLIKLAESLANLSHAKPYHIPKPRWCFGTFEIFNFQIKNWASWWRFLGCLYENYSTSTVCQANFHRVDTQFTGKND